jgi:hypothetical protein
MGDVNLRHMVGQALSHPPEFGSSGNILQKEEVKDVRECRIIDVPKGTPKPSVNSSHD